MQDRIARLLNLMCTCSEDCDTAKRLQYVIEIMHLSAYQKLVSTDSLPQIYRNKYSISELRKLGIKELKQAKQDILNTSKMFEELQCAIQRGNAPELTADDAPVIFDSKTMKSLTRKIRISDTVQNYSNIGYDQSLLIFEDTTIKSAKACIESLPISIAKKVDISEEEIVKAMGDRLFCISIDEFRDMHHRFIRSLNHATKVIEEEKVHRNRHRLFKVSVIMLFGLLVYVCIQMKLFPSAYLKSFIGYVFLLSVAYLLWG